MALLVNPQDQLLALLQQQETVGYIGEPVSQLAHALQCAAFAARESADESLILAALLHDAPEYVIGDMISPVKSAVGPGYGELDERLTAAIHIRFGLPATLPTDIKKSIKAADRVSAWLEAINIAGFTQPEADKLFGKPDTKFISGLTITLRSAREVRSDFIARHNALIALVG